MIRRLPFPVLLLALLLGAALPAAGEEQEDSNFTAADLSQLSDAIAAGLPDPTGATIWSGDALGEKPRGDSPREVDWGWPRLHLQLRDGRWLVHGIALRPTGSPESVLAAGFKKLMPSEADAQGMCLPPTGLPLYATRFGAQVQNVYSLVYPRWAEVGWTTVAPLECSTRPGEKQSRPDETQVSRADYVRRELHLLALAMALHSPRGERPGLLRAAAAMLSAAETTVRAPALERILDLPDPGPTGAQDLKSRLRTRQPPWSSSARHGGIPAEVAAQSGEEPFDDADTDGMVALLDSNEPAIFVRWPDYTPPTIGDIAWRELAWLWGLDPRWLVDRDSSVPWTDEERTISARAVQVWWRAHSAERFPAALISDPSHLPLLWETRAVDAARPADAPMLAGAIAGHWRSQPRESLDRVSEASLVDILRVLGEQPDIEHLVLSWPIAGPHRANLGILHEAHEEDQALTGLLRDLLQEDPPAAGDAWHLANCIGGWPIEDKADRDLASVYQATMRRPSRERYELLTSAAQAPVGSWPWNIAHQIALFGLYARSRWRADLLDSWTYERGNTHLPRILAFMALTDTRTIPIASQFKDPRAISDRPTGDPTLRVCDEVAMALSQARLKSGEGPAAPPGFTFPLGPADSRDAKIHELREWLLPSVATARAAAGIDVELGFMGPPPPPFPEWWQRELDATQAAGQQAVGLLVTNTETCAPCRRLDREVLTQPVWTAWAAQHLRMVVLDGAGHREGDPIFDRMMEVHSIYPLCGTPTFILIAADGHQLGPSIDYEPGGPDTYISRFERRLADAARH